jgi:hypothetical protein
MKNIVIILSIIYLAPGILLALDHHSRESNTFECKLPESPHGYITIWKEKGGNPDREKCLSRGKKNSSVKDMVLLTFFGTPLLIMKAVH